MENQQIAVESVPQEVLNIPPPPIIPVTQEPAAGKKSDPQLLAKTILGLIGFAILVLIVIPRPYTPSRKALEATLRANLHQLRNALGCFEADTGVYPNTLKDLVTLEESALATRVPKGTYKGPYLTTSGGLEGKGIPMNPFAERSAYIGQHWSYKSGQVHSAVRGVTLDGTPYEEL
ncbi:MAG: hypothetical protein ACYC7E_01995 [Armatimonadota bacterium]